MIFDAFVGILFGLKVAFMPVRLPAFTLKLGNQARIKLGDLG